MKNILEALLRTITEAADSKKDMISTVGLIAVSLSSIIMIPDPTIKGIVVAISTAIIVGAYILGQAYVDAYKNK